MHPDFVDHLKRGQLEGKPAEGIRKALMSVTDPNKLYSLDEAVGTVVTLSTVIFGLLSLYFPEMRVTFSLLTLVSTFFFWVSYRIAKIKHAIELRIWIIKAFTWFVPGVVSIPFFLLSEYFKASNPILDFLFLSVGVSINLRSLDFARKLDPWKYLRRDNLGLDEEEEHNQAKMENQLIKPTHLLLSAWGAIPGYLFLILIIQPSIYSPLTIISAIIVLSALALKNTSEIYKERLDVDAVIFRSKQDNRKNLAEIIVAIIGFIGTIVIGQLYRMIHIDSTTRVLLKNISFFANIIYWPSFLFLAEPADGY